MTLATQYEDLIKRNGTCSYMGVSFHPCQLKVNAEFESVQVKVLHKKT